MKWPCTDIAAGTPGGGAGRYRGEPGEIETGVQVRPVYICLTLSYAAPGTELPCGATTGGGRSVAVRGRSCLCSYARDLCAVLSWGTGQRAVLRWGMAQGRGTES